MEHWNNFSLENLTEEIEGIVYTEEWRPVVGFEGRYEVSSFGRVKSFVANKGNLKEKILKYAFHRNGYAFITLAKVGKTKYFSIHRLVAINFLQNPNDLPEVNHKTGVKTKNAIWQIEWSTISNNRKHAYEIGLVDKDKIKNMLGKFGEKHHLHKKLIQMDLNGIEIKSYNGTREAARETGICQTTISAVCRKSPKYKTAGGFKWKYV